MLSRSKFWSNNNQLHITRAITMAPVINYSNASKPISVPYKRPQFSFDTGYRKT